jgi:energy-coupling factor transporter ATP-binding protein EcfA2
MMVCVTYTIHLSTVGRGHSMWPHGPRRRAPLRFPTPAFITVCGATNKRPVNELLLDGTVVELMMPVQSRRQGDDLLVDNVDLKRAARNLLNKTRSPGWVPPADLNQAMELMAGCFGYANLLAANKQALQAPTLERNSRQSGASPSDDEGIKRRDAGSHGMATLFTPVTFPEVVSPRFDQRWKNLVSTGFYSCLAGVARPGEVIAIIGRPGAGKSLLANAMAQSMGGEIVDFRKSTWQQDFDRVLASPPKLLFVDELYYHAEATEMRVATFVATALVTKTAFLFQRLEDVKESLLNRRDADGKQLFTKVHVLDLDRMTLHTISPWWGGANDSAPVALDSSISTDGSFGQAAPAPRQRPVPAPGLDRALQQYMGSSTPTKGVPVLVAAENVRVQDIMALALEPEEIAKASTVDCMEDMSRSLAEAMRRSPNIIIFDNADRAQPEALGECAREALSTGFHICLRVGSELWKGPEGLDIGWRCRVDAVEASALVTRRATRRKPRL